MSIHFRPRESFTRIVELTPALRREIEATVEQLISILDLFDGDENVEDDGCAEPSLGWPTSGTGAIQNVPYHDDREVEDEHDEDCGDDEISAGE